MSIDLRIYPTFQQLAQLAKAGRQFSWHPPYQRLTALTGKHRSHQRGRGLDFIELRHYHPGDDVRHIDWRVTQRTGKPYLRVYAEENDKNIALLVDLRNTMFFASDGQMKSVVATELAALCIGAACKEGDRVGAVILTVNDILFEPFRRGEKAAMALLQRLETYAQRLPQWDSVSSAPSLSDGLKHLVDLGLKESQCFIMSDFHDYEAQEANTLLHVLAKRNSLIGFKVMDPLEERFPHHSFVLGDEEGQVEIPSSGEKVRFTYEQFVTRHNQQLSSHFNDLKLSLIEITTHRQVWSQLQEMSDE